MTRFKYKFDSTFEINMIITLLVAILINAHINSSNASTSTTTTTSTSTTSSPSLNNNSDSGGDFLLNYHEVQKEKRLKHSKMILHTLEHLTGNEELTANIERLFNLQAQNNTLRKTSALVLQKAGIRSIQVNDTDKMIDLSDATKEKVNLLKPLFTVLINRLSSLDNIENNNEMKNQSTIPPTKSTICPKCKNSNTDSPSDLNDCPCCPLCRDCLIMECPRNSCPTCKPNGEKDAANDDDKKQEGKSRAALKRRKHRRNKLKKANRRKKEELEMLLQQLPRDQRNLLENKLKTTEIIMAARGTIELFDKHSLENKHKNDLERIKLAQMIISQLSFICGHRDTSEFAKVIESGKYLSEILLLLAQQSMLKKAGCKLCSTKCSKDKCFEQCKNVLCERCKCRLSKQCDNMTTTTCRPCKYSVV